MVCSSPQTSFIWCCVRFVVLERSVLEKSAHLRFTSERSTPERFASVRSALERFAPESLDVDVVLKAPV